MPRAMQNEKSLKRTALTAALVSFSNSTASPQATSISHSAPPLSSPSPTSSATSFKAPRTIFENTSIASATCPNGDRWVFFQDVFGGLRSVQYSQAMSTWRVPANGTIPSVAQLGTSLSAACVIVPEKFLQTSEEDLLSYAPAPGIWVSIVHTSCVLSSQSKVFSRI